MDAGLREFIDANCGRIADIVLDLSSARTLYFQLNPGDTEADFQAWLDSLPDKE